MLIPDFIPIETHGMSIFTAIIFFFLGVGMAFFYQMATRECKRINEEIKRVCKDKDEKINDTNDKVDLLFEKIDSTNRDISEIKTDIARTLEAVEWIKKSMEHS